MVVASTQLKEVRAKEQMEQGERGFYTYPCKGESQRYHGIKKNSNICDYFD